MYSIFRPNLLISFIKRKILPKSLLSRFVLIIVVPTLIGQFFALHLFYERHWYNVSYHTSSLITAEIVSLLKTEQFHKHKNQQRIYINLSYMYKTALDPSSHLADDAATDYEELQIFKKSLSNKVNFPHKVFIDDKGKIVVNIIIDEDLLTISFPSKILINPTTYIFVLWVIFLTILLLSVSLIFSKNQIKSILDLTNAAEKYGRGENMEIYKPSGAREIRRAGLAFIKMKDRIERQTTRRTQMLAMISHDLKTPLTRMKLQVELMDNTEEKEELNHDIDSMKYMISSYLDFARGEGGENFTEVELSQWVGNYITTFWSSLDIQYCHARAGGNLAKKVDPRLRGDENSTHADDSRHSSKKRKIFAKIKPHSFQRALDNIVSNATKYSTKIKISVYSHNKNVIITIEDNGKGIDEAERNLVFKPFYRSDKARTLESSGSVGLGLAITKEIITGHYGVIELGKSKSLKGLLVKIKIPLINLRTSHNQQLSIMRNKKKIM